MKIYSRAEASRALKLTLPSMDRYIDLGELNCHESDGREVFSEKDIYTFMENHPNAGLTNERRRSLHDTRCGEGSYDRIVRELKTGKLYADIARSEDVTTSTVSQIDVFEAPEGREIGYGRKSTLAAEKNWRTLLDHEIFGPFYRLCNGKPWPYYVRPINKTRNGETIQTNFSRTYAFLEGVKVQIIKNTSDETDANGNICYNIPVPSSCERFLFVLLYESKEETNPHFFLAPRSALPSKVRLRVSPDSKYYKYYDHFGAIAAEVRSNRKMFGEKYGAGSLMARRSMFDMKYGNTAIEELHDMLCNPSTTYAAIAIKFRVSRELARQWPARYFPGECRSWKIARRKYELKSNRSIAEAKSLGKAEKRRDSMLYRSFSRIVERKLPKVRFEPSEDRKEEIVIVGGKRVALRKAISRHNGLFTLNPPRPSVGADIVWYYVNPRKSFIIPVSSLGAKQTTLTDSPMSPYRKYRNNYEVLTT